MSISPNSIFHVTNFNGLKSILKDKSFKINYCREIIETLNDDYNFIGVPMVSFCDIPLYEIKTQLKSYGGYCIGLKKSWAAEKGLSPVIYLEKNSNILSSSLDILHSYIFKDNDPENMSEVQIALANFYRHIKNYEGDLIRKHKTYKNYRFSNEREWRYCPTKNELKNYPYLLDTTFTKTNIKYAGAFKVWSNVINKANTNISNIKLHFDLNDISCIIVKNEKQIFTIIKLLNIHTADKKLISKLTARIIISSEVFPDL